MFEYAIYKILGSDCILYFDRITYLTLSEAFDYKQNYAYKLIMVNPHEAQQLPLFIIE